MKAIFLNLAAAVFGYLVMFTVAFVLFFLMWAVLGSDGSFQPGSWAVSGQWIIGSIVFGMLVSIAGGFTAGKLGANRGGVVMLVVLVLLFGVGALIPVAEEAGRRPEIVSMFDAMASARQPRWLLMINPLLGVIGVALGGFLALREADPS